MGQEWQRTGDSQLRCHSQYHTCMKPPFFFFIHYNYNRHDTTRLQHWIYTSWQWSHRSEQMKSGLVPGFATHFLWPYTPKVTPSYTRSLKLPGTVIDARKLVHTHTYTCTLDMLVGLSAACSYIYTVHVFFCFLFSTTLHPISYFRNCSKECVQVLQLQTFFPTK